MSFAQRCQDMIAQDAIDDLLALYCDPAVHTLPTDQQQHLRAYADPERLLASMQRNLDIYVDDSSDIAKELAYSYMTPTVCAAHPDHFLLDAATYEDLLANDRPQSGVHEHMWEAWHECIGNHADQHSDLADALAARAVAHHDGYARSAFQALLNIGTHHTQAHQTCHDLLAQPVATCTSTTPQDDLIALCMDPTCHPYAARWAEDPLALQPAFFIRQLQQADNDPYTLQQTINHCAQYMSRTDARQVVDVLMDSDDMRAAAYAQMATPSALTVSPDYTAHLQKEHADIFYNLVIDTDSLPDDIRAATVMVAQQRQNETDHIWAIANDAPVAPVTDRDCPVYMEHDFSDLHRAIINNHPDAFVKHVGTDRLVAHLTDELGLSDPFDSYLVDKNYHMTELAKGLTLFLSVGDARSAASAEKVIHFITTNHDHIDVHQRDQLLSAIMTDPT